MDICPNGALKQCVKEYSVDDIIKILRRDFNNWDLNGGVTFSGGEPLLHHEFLIEVLKKCKDLQIHTSIETSAYVAEKIFLDVFKYIDFAFIDLKHMDPVMHKEGTSVDNARIHSNIEALVRSKWPGRLVLRQPTIAGFNDSEENARKIISFMKENSLYEINLLKFHRLGKTKWDQLDRDFMYTDQGDVTMEQLQALQSLYLENDIACYVGDDTPF